jgi:hypothetical protein
VTVGICWHFAVQLCAAWDGGYYFKNLLLVTLLSTSYGNFKYCMFRHSVMRVCSNEFISCYILRNVNSLYLLTHPRSLSKYTSLKMFPSSMQECCGSRVTKGMGDKCAHLQFSSNITVIITLHPLWITVNYTYIEHYINFVCTEWYYSSLGN